MPTNHNLLNIVQRYEVLCSDVLCKIDKFTDDHETPLSSYFGYAETDQGAHQYAILTIDQINLASFYDRLHKCEAMSSQWEEELGTKDYNKPYTVYLETKLQSVIPKLDALSSSLDYLLDNPEAIESPSGAIGLAEALSNLDPDITPAIDAVYDQFKYGDRNYVVFGKNGSGKTSLSNTISTKVLSSNSVVIPANRSVYLNQYQRLFLKSTLQLNQKLALSNAIQCLIQELRAPLRSHETTPTRRDSIILQLKQIFESLGLQRKIYICGDIVSLATEEDGEENAEGEVIHQSYYLDDGSDGERATVYLILAVLLAPTDALIFVDEPENHLHGALLCALFDALERARPDARFIYLTHKIEFIETRTNAELIYLEKSKTHNEWKLYKLENYDDISLDIILDIEGLRNTVIFCEGNDRTSIDARILRAVYPDFTIKPVRSCTEVINSTIAINRRPELYHRIAFGLVDGDQRPCKEIKRLKEQHVLVLPYNECENLFCDKDVIKLIGKAKGLDADSIITSLLRTIEDSKNSILTDFLQKNYGRTMQSGLRKLTRGDTLEKQLRDDIAKKPPRIIADDKDKEQKFDCLVRNGDYRSLAKFVPGKTLLGQVIGHFYSTKDDYLDMVLTMVATNKRLRDLFAANIGLEDFINSCQERKEPHYT